MTLHGKWWANVTQNGVVNHEPMGIMVIRPFRVVLAKAYPLKPVEKRLFILFIFERQNREGS
jgi:hypothetical protein